MAAASRCALAVGVLTALAFGGCSTTTASSTSLTGRVTPAQGPTTTGIAEAARCTIHDGAKEGLPALREKDVFPTAGTVAWSPSSMNSLGPTVGIWVAALASCHEMFRVTEPLHGRGWIRTVS